MGYGVLFYAYGVLLVPMEKDLGWRRSVLTGAFSAALLVAAIMTVPVGRWLDRHPPRALLITGGLAGALLMATAASVRHPIAFYAAWTALGACMAVLFYEPAFTILTKRFRGAERRRAVTTVTLLAGLASTIFGPLTAVLVGLFGWRGAMLVLAGLLGVVTVPLFAVALRPSIAARLDERQADEPPATVPRAALASRRFWCLTAAYLLSAVTSYAMAVHLVPYLRAQKWAPGSAAVALGAIGVVQVVGRSAFARLSDRFAPAQLGTWVLGSKAVGVAALLVVPGVPGVVTFVAIYGAANGLTTLTRATVIADLYGAAHYGSISAVVSAVSAVGGALAPFGVAGAIEFVGGDRPVLWGLVALSALSALVHELAVGDRIRSRTSPHVVAEPWPTE